MSQFFHDLEDQLRAGRAQPTRCRPVGWPTMQVSAGSLAAPPGCARVCARPRPGSR